MAKNDMEHDISKSYGRIGTKLGGRVREVTGTSQLDYGSGPAGCRSGQSVRYTRELFNMAEVCTILSAVLVIFGDKRI